MKESYFIVQNSSNPLNRDVIHERNSGLKVSVYDLRDEVFHPKPNEVHYFGETAGKEIVFETVGYRGEFQALILSMISRYALYINEPFMKLSPLRRCA
ncbi:MAG: hypothetical protein ACOH2A_08860 [Sphingobacteriaceae bacterium]